MRVGAIARIEVYQDRDSLYGVALRADDGAEVEHDTEYPLEKVHKDRAVSVALAIWEAASRVPELVIGR